MTTAKEAAGEFQMLYTNTGLREEWISLSSLHIFFLFISKPKPPTLCPSPYLFHKQLAVANLKQRTDVSERERETEREGDRERERERERERD